MKVLFWNVDTQKDFMLKEGKLYIEGAESIIPNLKKLTELAREKNIKVVNTADYHTSTSSELSDKPDFINTFPEHCMAGTPGGDFIDETYPKCMHDNYYIVAPNDAVIDEATFGRARNIVIFKDKFDVFTGNPHTKEALRLLNLGVDFDLIVVYGVASNVCVKFAVEGLLKEGFKVAVIRDAIKGIAALPDPIEDWFLAGVNIISTETLINLLKC